MKNIYTKAIIVLICFAYSFNSFSQSGWDTLPWKSYADFRLQPLNKSYVTTGVLYDRVFPIAHMDEHTGLSTNEVRIHAVVGCLFGITRFNNLSPSQLK